MVKGLIFVSFFFTSARTCEFIHGAHYSVVDAVVKVEQCISNQEEEETWYAELLMGDIHFLLGNYSNAEGRYLRVWESASFTGVRCLAGEKLIGFYRFTGSNEDVMKTEKIMKRLCPLPLSVP